MFDTTESQHTVGGVKFQICVKVKIYQDVCTVCYITTASTLRWFYASWHWSINTANNHFSYWYVLIFQCFWRHNGDIYFGGNMVVLLFFSVLFWNYILMCHVSLSTSSLCLVPSPFCSSPVFYQLIAPSSVLTSPVSPCPIFPSCVSNLLVPVSSDSFIVCTLFCFTSRSSPV